MANYKLIPLTQGKFAIVDTEDYDWLIHYKWRTFKGQNTYYAIMGRDTIFMHRLLNKTPKGLITDHKNHNGLDNRKDNLRSCTQSQNLMNRTTLQRNNKSGYTGIYWKKDRNRWYVRVKVKGKNIYLGSFRNIKDAVKARKTGEMKYYGKYMSEMQG